MNLKRQIVRNCIPAVICMVLNGIYTIIDGLFIGQNVGETGLAAINLVWPVPAVITAVGTAIGSGGGICISLQKGMENQKEEQLIFQNIFILFIGAALLLTFTMCTGMEQILTLLGATGEVGLMASEYGLVVSFFAIIPILGSGIIPMLRNAGKPVLAMWCMICGLLGNICLIYGEALLIIPLFLLVFPKVAGIKGVWSEPFAAAAVCLAGVCFLRNLF